MKGGDVDRTGLESVSTAQVFYGWLVRSSLEGADTAPVFRPLRTQLKTESPGRRLAGFAMSASFFKTSAILAVSDACTANESSGAEGASFVPQKSRKRARRHHRACAEIAANPFAPFARVRSGVQLPSCPLRLLRFSKPPAGYDAWVGRWLGVPSSPNAPRDYEARSSPRITSTFAQPVRPSQLLSPENDRAENLTHRSGHDLVTMPRANRSDQLIISDSRKRALNRRKEQNAGRRTKRQWTHNPSLTTASGKRRPISISSTWLAGPAVNS